MGLEEALSECDTFVAKDDIPWSKLAEKHRVVRSTLTRKWRGETRSREEQAVAQQKLTLQQEAELVKYIEELTARRIPPTREMIQNFALAVAFFSTPSVGSVRHPCEKCGAIRAGRGMAGSSRPSLWILVLGCCLSPTLVPDRLCGITARWVRGCWRSVVWSRSARRHLASSSATSADGIPASLKRMGRDVVLYAGSIALAACTSTA